MYVLYVLLFVISGSLDEETFETIQKQLLSRETLYEMGAVGSLASSPSIGYGHRLTHTCIHTVHTHIHTYIHTYIHTNIHSCIHTYVKGKNPSLFLTNSALSFSLGRQNETINTDNDKVCMYVCIV